MLKLACHCNLWWQACKTKWQTYTHKHTHTHCSSPPIYRQELYLFSLFLVYSWISCRLCGVLLIYIHALERELASFHHRNFLLQYPSNQMLPPCFAASITGWCHLIPAVPSALSVCRQQLLVGHIHHPSPITAVTYLCLAWSLGGFSV